MRKVKKLVDMSLIEIFSTHIYVFHIFEDVHICTYIQGFFYIHYMNIA